MQVGDRRRDRHERSTARQAVVGVVPRPSAVVAADDDRLVAIPRFAGSRNASHLHVPVARDRDDRRRALWHARDAPRRDHGPRSPRHAQQQHLVRGRRGLGARRAQRQRRAGRDRGQPHVVVILGGGAETSEHAESGHGRACVLLEIAASPAHQRPHRARSRVTLPPGERDDVRVGQQDGEVAVCDVARIELLQRHRIEPPQQRGVGDHDLAGIVDRHQAAELLAREREGSEAAIALEHREERPRVWSRSGDRRFGHARRRAGAEHVERATGSRQHVVDIALTERHDPVGDDIAGAIAGNEPVAFADRPPGPRRGHHARGGPLASRHRPRDDDAVVGKRHRARGGLGIGWPDEARREARGRHGASARACLGDGDGRGLRGRWTGERRERNDRQERTDRHPDSAFRRRLTHPPPGAQRPARTRRDQHGAGNRGADEEAHGDRQAKANLHVSRGGPPPRVGRG